MAYENYGMTIRKIQLLPSQHGLDSQCQVQYDTYNLVTMPPVISVIRSKSL